jgi:hypothetical protein
MLTAALAGIVLTRPSHDVQVAALGAQVDVTRRVTKTMGTKADLLTKTTSNSSAVPCLLL